MSEIGPISPFSRIILEPIAGAVRLNIGCGRCPHPWYWNLDSDPEVGRFVASLHMRFILAPAHELPVLDASIDLIYASHLLEHYAPDRADAETGLTVATLLREWHRVLRPDGTFYVAVPDLLVCCRQILASPAQRSDWIANLFGYSKKQGMAHLWAYDEASLRALLERHGFAVSGRFSPFLRDPSDAAFDASGGHGHDDEGRHIPCSLNLHAIRLPNSTSLTADIQHPTPSSGSSDA